MSKKKKPTEKSGKKKKPFSDIFSKYKTYDTAEGFGNSEQWKDALKKRMGKDEPEIKYFSDCDTMPKLTSKYRELMKKHHPDIAGETEENKQITQEIIDEYNLCKKTFQ